MKEKSNKSKSGTFGHPKKSSQDISFKNGTVPGKMG
jgi:hypothetical protein